MLKTQAKRLDKVEARLQKRFDELNRQMWQAVLDQLDDDEAGALVSAQDKGWTGCTEAEQAVMHKVEALALGPLSEVYEAVSCLYVALTACKAAKGAK